MPDPADDEPCLADDGRPVHPDAADVEALLRKLIARAETAAVGSHEQYAILGAAREACSWLQGPGWRRFSDPTLIRHCLDEIYQMIGQNPRNGSLRRAADSLEKDLSRIVPLPPAGAASSEAADERVSN